MIIHLLSNKKLEDLIFYCAPLDI